MKKKGRIDWAVILIVLGFVLLFITIGYGLLLMENYTLEKYTELCERKDMTYFDIKAERVSVNLGSYIRVVICLDNNGEQHVVVLK